MIYTNIIRVAGPCVVLGVLGATQVHNANAQQPAATATVGVTAPVPSASATAPVPPAPTPLAAPTAPAAPPAPPMPSAAPPAPTVEAATAPSVAVDEVPALPTTEAPVVDPVPEAEEPPAEEAPTFPSSLKIGVGVRTGLALTFKDPASNSPHLGLNDGVAHQLNVRPGFSGALTENIGFAFNLEAFEDSISVLDAVLQIKVVDEFQVWMGQHIPAMERNNFNGPFYNNGWNLPIGVQTLPFDIAGRDRGATFWGLIGGGVLKYHASIVDVAPGQESTFVDADDNEVTTKAGSLKNARYAARATINFLDPENYYYTSGTYYGSQDTLALGAVLQYQKGVDAIGGDDLDNDLLAFTADLLFEKVLDGGTFTLNGGYWNFKGVGANYKANQGTTQFGTGVGLPGDAQSYLVGLSWLTEEKFGIGQLQPNVTVQIGDYDPTMVVVDAGVGYIVDGFNHRWILNYRRADNGGDSKAIDMLQLGAQVQL